MEMIPPSLKEEIDGTAMIKENDRELISTCGNASLGIGMNRLPVKRRLFADESPENSPPHLSLDSKLADLFESEKARALRGWGFDITTDTPSTSSEFDYVTVNSSVVPSFYTRVHGCRTAAAFSPKQKARSISLLPISLPSKSDNSEPVGVTEAMTDEEEVTESPANTPAKVPSELVSAIILSKSSKKVNSTPRGKKKRKAPISGQALLTSFYRPQKRQSHADSSPMDKRKRVPAGASASATRGEAQSTAIRP